MMVVRIDNGNIKHVSEFALRKRALPAGESGEKLSEPEEPETELEDLDMTVAVENGEGKI